MIRESLMPAPMFGRYLVVLTEVRPLVVDDSFRDERRRPERRCQVATVDSPEAAGRLARAFAALGMVRAGRQRVKVLAVGHRGRLRGGSHGVRRAGRGADDQ